MQYDKSLIRTMRENPSNCDDEVYALMLRTGMIKQESSGLYTYMPFFNMALKKVEDIIREELNRINAQECKFPILVSRELLEASGRWTAFGDEMFALKDRHENEYALSPTNEEAAAMIAKQYVTSFRDLPLTVYQINTKHRDEIRPRGIGRTRAFTMKDAYSFHATDENLNEIYELIVNVYIKIFKRLGLEAFPVNADNGTMGGSGSQEIMVEKSNGDNEVARCTKCGYAANTEVVECIDTDTFISSNKGKFEKVLTPHVGTIEELTKFFNTDEKHFAKSMVYKTDSGELVIAVVRGDRNVNDVKLRNYLKAKSVELALVEDIVSINSYVGFVGPVNLNSNIKIIVDNEVKHMEDFIVGANEKDYHYSNANCSDFNECVYADIRNVAEGDIHSCGEKFSIVHADELGHCFKLGKRYTDKMNVTFVDTDGTNKLMTMGCYGIGLERTVTAIIEKYHDEKGLLWPMSLAPFKVNVIPTNKNLFALASEIYNKFEDEKIDTLYDNRDVSIGVKFKDSDLLGIPLKVIIGKKYDQEGLIEIETRTGEKYEVEPAELMSKVKELINEKM